MRHRLHAHFDTSDNSTAGPSRVNDYSFIYLFETTSKPQPGLSSYRLSFLSPILRSRFASLPSGLSCSSDDRRSSLSLNFIPFPFSLSPKRRSSFSPTAHFRSLYFLFHIRLPTFSLEFLDFARFSRFHFFSFQPCFASVSSSLASLR
jgi:hypothetical protein